MSLLAQSSITGSFHSGVKKFKEDGVVGLAPDVPLLLPLTCLDIVAEGQCRWPMDNVACLEGLACCGRACREGGSPYCAIHHARAYTRKPTLVISDADAAFRHQNGVVQSRKNRMKSKNEMFTVLSSVEDIGL